MQSINIIESQLQDDMKKTLAAIADSIVWDLVLFADDIGTNNLIVATEIALAIDAAIKNKNFTSRAQVTYPAGKLQSFFDLHQESLQSLTVQLYALKETALFNDINTLGKMLYGPKWFTEINVDHDNALLASENTKVILYRAKSGELGIRFPNEAMCSQFAMQVKPAVIPEQFRTGPQYQKNPQGYTPVCYADQKNHIFIPSYKARNKEFAINCGKPINRDRLIIMLGLKVTSNEEIIPGEIRTMYGDGLFAIYSNPAQKSAIYFNSNNKIFTHSGAFLKIDTLTGVITPGVMKNYNEIVEKEAIRLDYELFPEEHLALDVSSIRLVDNPAPIKKCLLTVVSNADFKPELEIKFPNQASRDKWHATFIDLAKIIGVEIANNSFVETSAQDPLILRIKPFLGKGDTGVCLFTPKQVGVHFQPRPQLSIGFGDGQLQRFFVTTLNINDEVAPMAQMHTLHFNSNILPPRIGSNLETEFNVDALSDYVAFCSSAEESMGHSAYLR